MACSCQAHRQYVVWEKRDGSRCVTIGIPFTSSEFSWGYGSSCGFCSCRRDAAEGAEARRIGTAAGDLGGGFRSGEARGGGDSVDLAAEARAAAARAEVGNAEEQCRDTGNICRTVAKGFAYRRALGRALRFGGSRRSFGPAVGLQCLDCPGARGRG